MVLAITTIFRRCNRACYPEKRHGYTRGLYMRSHSQRSRYRTIFVKPSATLIQQIWAQRRSGPVLCPCFWFFSQVQFSCDYPFTTFSSTYFFSSLCSPANTLQRHYTENSKQMFPKMKLVPNSYIHVYIHVSESVLYIPTIGLPILLLLPENKWTDRGSI